MRVRHYVTHEGKDAVDVIGVLDDGRVFWAWARVIDEDELSIFVQRYAEHPEECTAEQGASVFNTLEELQAALDSAGRDDLGPLTEDPVFVVAGGVGPGSRWEKRATLAECVEMVRTKRGE